jgi:hypothetical protein
MKHGGAMQNINKKILVLGFALALSSCGMVAKDSVPYNDLGITEAYLGCLMYRPDILECKDLKFAAEQARYNKIKPPAGRTIEINQPTTSR